MNVKSVVKVMNFHALLHVDAASNLARKYSSMEQELMDLMQIIQNNKNLNLDRKIKLPDMSLPALRIYIGSDFGFCGSVNTSVSSVQRQDDNSEKIVIGKKLHRGENIILSMNQDEVSERFNEIESILCQAVKDRKWSSIELVYNHFYNISSVRQIEKRIYPLEKSDNAGESGREWDDFLIEGDSVALLEDITVAILNCELRIAVASAFASENIMRQNATSESLKKLEEIEADNLRETRKQRSQASFRKTIDSYVKQKSLR